MVRGDRVRVRAYPDKVLERVFWEELPTSVMVCRPEVYEATLTSGQPEPAFWMVFPKEDVVSAEPSSA